MHALPDFSCLCYRCGWFLGIIRPRFDGYGSVFPSIGYFLAFLFFLLIRFICVVLDSLVRNLNFMTQPVIDSNILSIYYFLTLDYY